MNGFKVRYSIEVYNQAVDNLVDSSQQSEESREFISIRLEKFGEEKLLAGVSPQQTSETQTDTARGCSRGRAQRQAQLSAKSKIL